MKIEKKLDKVPADAKMEGKLDCMCNHCHKKTFHYLYEKGTKSFIKCIVCYEIWEVSFQDATGTA